VQALVRDGVEVPELTSDETGQVVLRGTPLYAESGGQVGEKGELIWEGGRADVCTSSAPVPGLIAHVVILREGTLRQGARLQVRCDPAERRATRRNHTATHLLHAVLKQVLGAHVKQAGSLVAPDRLRFDFTHYRALTPARLREIEGRVNDRILANSAVTTRVQDLEAAIASGAMALFGEKYGDRVRVVEVPGFSSELCGGLHCSATGDIGLFKIVGERGIAAGIRRLEALTGEGALERFHLDEEALAQAAVGLGVPRDEVAAAIQRLVQRQKSLQKELDRLRLKIAGAGEQADEIQEVGDLKILARRTEDLDRSQMRQLADALKEKADIVVLATRRQDRVALLVAVRDGASRRVPAGQVVDRLARLCGGRGGGKPTLAEAGGKDPGDLDGVLRQGGRVVDEILRGQESS
jgi:alanyl-tRNA synthetase